MGWNTTVVVYNDALDQIEDDAEFGKKLSEAVRQLHTAQFRGKDHVDIPSGCHANAAMVVESHHADATAVITVGGNLGVCHLVSHGWDHHTPQGQERLLKAWASKLGYDLVKKNGDGGSHGA